MIELLNENQSIEEMSTVQQQLLVNSLFANTTILQSPEVPTEYVTFGNQEPDTQNNSADTAILARCLLNLL